MPDVFSKPLVSPTDISQNQNFGVAILFLAGFCFLASVLDAQAKYLTETLPVVQVTWARYFFHTLFIAPIVLYAHGLAALHPQQMTRQVLRGSYLFVSTLLYFLALSEIQIAQTQVLVFSSPLAVTLLSIFLLKEKVGIHRWAAVVIGFVGVLIALNPGTDNIASIGSLAAFAAGITYGFYIIATRQLMHSPPLVTLFFTGIVGTVILTALMPFFWQAPNSTELLLMVTLGLCGACSHLCIIQAFRRAAASSLSPWIYMKMIFTVFWGYYLFSEVPLLTTWIGGGIIICSGIYIWWREQLRSKI